MDISETHEDSVEGVYNTAVKFIFKKLFQFKRSCVYFLHGANYALPSWFKRVLKPKTKFGQTATKGDKAMPKKPAAEATKTSKASDSKTAKKSTKKKAADSGKKETKANSNGLTPTQVKILTALKNTVAGKKEMSYGDIREATELNKGLSKAVGTPSKDEVGENTLMGRKMVVANKYEGTRGWQFSITEKGKKALQEK